MNEKIHHLYNSDCKDCGCSPSWHTSQFNHCRFHRISYAENGHFTNHQCWGYLPSDNLEYLEYMNERSDK